MYYDNKSTFYVKQYGPTVLVCILSLILIGSGVFIYFKSSKMDNPFKKNAEIAQTVDTNAASITTTENTAETAKTESNALATTETTETKPAAITISLSDYITSLKDLEKSKEFTVTDISTTGIITVDLDGEKAQITLIGIDFKYTAVAAIEKIKTDLLNKKVTLVFDTLRTDNDKTYAYIYDGDTLYNAELLKSGVVTLKTERTNIKLNNELASAQAYARQNSLGVWKK